MSDRPLTYGEIEDALDLVEDRGVVHSWYYADSPFVQHEDGDIFKFQEREGIESLLEEAEADPSSVLDYHTRPERPDPSVVLWQIERRTWFDAHVLLEDPTKEDLDRTDLYLDASGRGEYHYANSTHEGIIAARVRDGTLSMGYIPVVNQEGEYFEKTYYSFRDMHSTDHLWAFLHDFTNAAPFYGNPDERFITVWSRCLVAIENDLFG